MWIRSSTNHSLVSSSARPTPPRTRRRRDADVGQHELRVPVGEGVGVVGVVLDDARRACRSRPGTGSGSRSSPSTTQAVEDHEVGVVRAGDEPLLAVEDVLAGRRVADGGRAQGAGVGAGAVLGDRVAPRALAAQRRLEVAPALLGVGVEQDVVGARDVRPQAAGRLAELLVDEHLLERPTSPARRPRPGSEPPWSRASIAAAPDRVAPVARDAAAGALELDLARLEDVPDERAGARLELELGRA